MVTSITDFERNCTALTDSMEDVGRAMESLSSASSDLRTSADALAKRVTELTAVMEQDA